MAVAEVVTLAVALAQVGNERLVLDEDVGVVEDGVDVGVAGLIRVAALTGVHGPDLLLDLFGRVGKEYRVVQALGHLLLSVRADEPPDATDQHLGDREHAAERGEVLVASLGIDAAVGDVESACDLAAHLDVGDLVLAHRHPPGTKGQDVGALPDRVHREPERVRVAQPLVLDLVLQRRVAHDAVEGQEHGEVPGQLGDGGNLGLEHDGRARRVDPARQPVLDDLDGVGADLGVLVGPGGEGVHVGQQEEAVVLVLESQAVLDRPDVMPQVQPTRGRVAGEDAWFGGVRHRSGV